MRSIHNICYSPDQGQYLDLYLPECDLFPVMVYFHGGGLEVGDKAGQPALVEYLTGCGIAVVSANYRMYPQAKYPDFLTDAAQAVAWVFRNIHNYGTATGIYVGGSSAGGYISQMLCFDPSWLAEQGLHPDRICGFIHDAGQPTCHFNVLRERGLDTRRVIIDESAPLYHIQADKPYPPMLIIVSDQDMPNRYEQTALLVSTLTHFGYGDRVTLRIMQGKHCAYVNKLDDQGHSILGQLVSKFIWSKEETLWT